MSQPQSSRHLLWPAFAGFSLLLVLSVLHFGERWIGSQAAARPPLDNSLEQSGNDNLLEQSEHLEIEDDSPRMPALVEEAERQQPPVHIDPRAQLFVYLLNRARNDPAAYEVQESLRNINLAATAPRPPLAISSKLAAAAQFRAAEMAEHNYFDHQSDVTGAWPNEIVRRQGFALPAYFDQDSNQVESIAAGGATASETLRQLILDEGVPSAGHRKHLLGMGDFYLKSNEVGVGYARSPDAKFRYYWAIHATFVDSDATFLTGVVFDDRNRDSRYNLDEGLAGVTVSAGEYVGITNSAGGWSLQVPSGRYDVEAQGANFRQLLRKSVLVEDKNVEVDFNTTSGKVIVGFAG